MFRKSAVRFAEIKDGTSQTLLVGERQVFPESDRPSGASEFGNNWAGYSIITTFYGINSGLTELESGVVCGHSGGANFTFADGHVSFISQTIRQQTLKAHYDPRAGQRLFVAIFTVWRGGNQ